MPPSEKDTKAIMRELLDVSRVGFEKAAESNTKFETELSLTRQKLDRIAAAVEGNGNKPLTERMSLVETGLKDVRKLLEQEIKERKEFQVTLSKRIWEIAKPLIAAVIGAVIGSSGNIQF